MTGCLLTPDSPDWPTTLVLTPVADPVVRRGLRERDPVHRLRGLLKDALRVYGLKCVVVRVPTAEEVLHAGEWW